MTDPVVLLSTGDVVGPSSSTDGTMVLFDGTSGKKLKGNNAVVTAQGLALLDDVDATANRATIGLGNVNNTSDIDKPVSTLQAASIATRAPIASPALTGVPTVPTAPVATDTTQAASTAFVKLCLAAIVNATETIFGLIRIGTQAEVDALTSDSVAVTPAKLKKHASLGGVGQTWQNVLASRLSVTVYTNTTGRPIMVKIHTTTTWPGTRELYVNGVDIDGQSIASNWNGTMAQSVVVPPGGTYQFSSTVQTPSSWMELR